MKCVLINIPAPGLPPATADIFEYPRGQGFRMGAPRRVGPWVFPERVVARQRLDAEEVEGRGIDMAGINRGNEIVIDHMFAARQIDDCGAFGQSGKVVPASLHEIAWAVSAAVHLAVVPSMHVRVWL